MNTDPAHVQQLTNQILAELFIALGLPRPGLLRRLLRPLFYKPAYRFAGIAATFDQITANQGFRAAAQWMLPIFVNDSHPTGQERVPTHGSLLVVSNHPGAYDSIAIAAALPRDDLKIVVSGVPFLHNLPNAGQHFLYTPGLKDAQGRSLVIRGAIRHLREGGAVFLFPTGLVDPDPEMQPGAGAALSNWSGSLEIMLRQAPETRLQPVIASGVLARQVFHSPIVRIRRAGHRRRVLAEFLQVVLQLLVGKKFDLEPSLTFGDALPPFREWMGGVGAAAGREANMAYIIATARQVLADHLQRLGKRAVGG